LSFYYKEKDLFVERIPVKRIAEIVKTPFYLYSSREIIDNFLSYKKSFFNKQHLICYAVKANSNLSILKMLARLGAGADIVSGGELLRALKAGVPANKIVYSGVGKSEEEIELAVKKQILMFNIESEQEFDLIQKKARDFHIKTNISFRVNPDVDPKTHPYISTGLKDNKFGISVDESLRLYNKARKRKFINISGISCHIGSQLLDLLPIKDAALIIRDIVNKLETDGINLRYIDLGGGLGIRYNEENPPSHLDHAQTIIEVINDPAKTIIIEPGRAIVGNAGALITKILYVKKHNGKIFYVVDSAMNDLIRPSIYKSYHEIVPLSKVNNENELINADIVGPICESGDYLAKDRKMLLLKQGDYLAVLSAGAYGFSMSSNYNSRPRATEILVRKYFIKIIRRHENFSDLISCEKQYL
jgi:diaminopimelate decarboxylase